MAELFADNVPIKRKQKTLLEMEQNYANKKPRLSSRMPKFENLFSDDSLETYNAIAEQQATKIKQQSTMEAYFYSLRIVKAFILTKIDPSSRGLYLLDETPDIELDADQSYTDLPNVILKHFKATSMPWDRHILTPFFAAYSRGKKGILLAPDTLGKARAAITWLHKLAKAPIPDEVKADVSTFFESYGLQYAKHRHKKASNPNPKAYVTKANKAKEKAKARAKEKAKAKAKAAQGDENNVDDGNDENEEEPDGNEIAGNAGEVAFDESVGGDGVVDDNSAARDRERAVGRRNVPARVARAAPVEEQRVAVQEGVDSGADNDGDGDEYDDISDDEQRGRSKTRTPFYSFVQYYTVVDNMCRSPRANGIDYWASATALWNSSSRNSTVSYTEFSHLGWSVDALTMKPTSVSNITLLLILYTVLICYRLTKNMIIIFFIHTYIL
jgi:hypothetical protein